MGIERWGGTSLVNQRASIHAARRTGKWSTGKDLCMLILQIRAFSPPELYGLYVVNSHKGGEGGGSGTP